MGCILVLLVFAFPRIVLVLMFLFSSFLERAYHGLILPILGFLFLPLTTIVYAWMVNSGYPTSGPYLLILLIAVIIDVSGHGGAYSRRRG
jgi:uncharacterized membrane protein YkvI